MPKYVRLKDFAPKPKIELLKNGTNAPVFKVKTIDDNTVKLKDLKGKVVLLLFFISSNYSLGKFPLVGLQSIRQKYPQTEILVFNCYGDDIDALKRIASTNAITLPISMDYESAKRDYNVTSFPTYYLIDENGKIFASFLGYSNKITENRIETALEKHSLINVPEK